jgi:hypothetical protein
VSAALSFARRVGARRTVLFHHDPLHSDDELDRFQVQAAQRWEELGCDPSTLEMAVERRDVNVSPAVSPQSTP